jgi:squalene-hopene/tetraprenyl-beta-curcumene cyclase
MKKYLLLFSMLFSLAGVSQAFAADNAKMDPSIHSKAKRAADQGMRYLRENQGKDGSWSNSVGITALALRAFLESHRGYSESDGPFIEKPIKYILDHVREDGSISESAQNRNYNTAVAITALQATGNPAYQQVIKNAQKFLKNLQLDEGEEYKTDHSYYGGIGYGGDERPDLSNQYLAMEALKATGVDPKDPVWEKALVFISRSQNRSESNDQEWAGNDGGFVYMPGNSPHGGTNSYGAMTHAGLISLIYAGVDKNDPRVQAAYDWIRANYTVDDNPGAKDKQGLFYYYEAFAKSMAAYGETEVADANGVAHNWRNDLAGKLIGLQDSDGSWVNKTSNRWWEGNKDLVTARSVIALNLIAK